MIYRDIIPVVQDVPIVTEEELQQLKQVKVMVFRGKGDSKHKVEVTLYTATDEEFMKWLCYITKTKRLLITGVPLDQEEIWTNVNRIRRRLNYLKRFKKSVIRYKKSLDTK